MKKRYLASVCAVGLLMVSQSALACAKQDAYAYVQCTTPRMSFTYKVCTRAFYETLGKTFTADRKTRSAGDQARRGADSAAVVGSIVSLGIGAAIIAAGDKKCHDLTQLLRLKGKEYGKGYSLYSVSAKHMIDMFKPYKDILIPESHKMITGQPGPWNIYVKDPSYGKDPK